MSIGFRTFPCKLTSVVGQWNQISQLDRRLTRLISTSTFLQEEKKISTKAIVNDKPTFALPRNKKTSIGFENLGMKLYSTAPELSKKSVDTLAPNQYSETRITENSDKSDGADEERLQFVFETIKKDLPKFFTTTMNYHIYSQDIEFINNYRGVTTKGLSAYIKQTLTIRFYAHVIYAYVKFDILKITLHPEDNTVKVRWRIRGLSTFKVFFNFWKLRLTNFNESLTQLETWHDGFSTFYVGSRGTVVRHIADKMMPDDDKEMVKAKPNIAAKLAA